ncbi:MAG: hypothetical protein H6682_04795 [Candidatus Eisenbacteria bacterium]|nr:hypothetical protein [Candidatus Eisenbacteria bacterium]
MIAAILLGVLAGGVFSSRSAAFDEPESSDPWSVPLPLTANSEVRVIQGAEVAARISGSSRSVDLDDLVGRSFVALEQLSGSSAGDDPLGGARQSNSTGRWSWTLARVLEAPKRTYVHFSPTLEGIPVEGLRATCVYSTSGQLLEVKQRVLGTAEGSGASSGTESGASVGQPGGSLGGSPLGTKAPSAADFSFRPGDRREAALRGITVNPQDIVWLEESERWLPVDSPEGPTLLPTLHYEFQASEGSPPYEAWVDARTGSLIGRECLARHVEGSVEGDIQPRTALDEPVRLPIGHANVTLRPAAGGEVIETTTDDAGQFEIPATSGQSYVLRTELAGPRIRIRDVGLAFATPADSVIVDGGDTHTFVWDASLAGRSARDAFYHGNVAYIFARSLDQGDALDPLDEGINVRVDATEGTCNAYWDGSGLTFYAAGGLCVATGQIADVVYHEYGHAVTTQVYRPFRAPRDMDEAFSDYFAATITDQPEIGQGFYGQPGTYIRELDTNRVWPEDANPTSPHIQGLILAGALWDLREELGPEVADPLFHFARYALPQSFDEFLIDLLNYDDDDGELANGTPNFGAIIDAFRPHGIGDYSVAIEAEPVPDIEAPELELTATARVLSLLGLDQGALQFHYRTVPDGAFDDVQAEPGSGAREFVARFAAPPLGSAVEYYWTAADTAGTTARFPAGDEVLTFLVGPDLLPPTLDHDPVDYLTTDQLDFLVDAKVRDNSGRIADVKVDYGLDGQTPLRVEHLSDTGDNRYRGAIAVGPLPAGSALEYSITAIDASAAGNSVSYPATGTHVAQVRTGATEQLEETDGGLSPSGDWEWGTPSGIPTPRFGAKVWATGLDRNYSNTTSSALVWGPVTVDAGSPRRLTFRHYMDFLEGVDGGQIQVSTNGATWSVVSPSTGYGGVTVSAWGDVAYTGTTEGWEDVIVALDRFSGSQIWVRFVTRSTGTAGAKGWYVDDLQIVSAQARVSPNTFTAGSGQSQAVPLAWRAPRGINTAAASFLGYAIYRTEGDAPYPDEPWQSGVRVTQLLDEDVTNGTTYRYRLHAVYEEGESPGVEQTARPAAPVFGFPVDEMVFRLNGASQSDTTLVVTNSGEGILEFNAYVAEADQSIGDVRIRASLEDLGEDPVVVFLDPSDAPGPDIAEISTYRTQGISGDLIHFEIRGHRNWGDPVDDFGGLLLLDTDRDLGTGPSSSVFDWDEDLNIGWDVGIMFGRLVRDQGSSAKALLFHADDLSSVQPLATTDMPENADHLTLTVPLSELGDPRAVDLSVIFSATRFSTPMDRAPDLPSLDWLRREPRKVRIRPGEQRPFSLEFDASSVGNGTYSARVYLTSNDPTVPQALLPVQFEASGVVPQDLPARSFRSLDDGFEVSFQAPIGLVANSAILERSLADEAVWTVLGDGLLVPDEAGHFEFMDQTATPGTSYDYRMRIQFAGLPGAYVFGPYRATYRPNAPSALALHLRSPNPFITEVELTLDVPIAGRARVEVFGVDGRRVASLLDNEVQPGRYPLNWGGSDSRGIYWAVGEVSGVGRRVVRLVQLR